MREDVMLKQETKECNCIIEKAQEGQLKIKINKECPIHKRILEQNKLE